MGSRATLNATIRCDRCQLMHRWCVCAAQGSFACSLAVGVLIHRRELQRPTSTGRLIHRTVENSRLHVYGPGRPLAPEVVRMSGRELWVLHPQGEDPPPGTQASNVQVLLLDGNWREAAAMARAVTGWGRRIRISMTGSSRYWLRAQREAAEYSTAEALAAVFGLLGLEAERAALNLQLELHVYAGLLSRGRKDEAARYLADSPVGSAFSDLVQRLNRKRTHSVGWKFGGLPRS